MILHFLGDSTYSNKFVEYVNINFSFQEHRFVFISKNELKYISETNNVLIYKSNSIYSSIRIIKKLLKQYKPEKLFLHFLSDLNLFPILFATKKTLVYWIVWGGDIYSYVDWELYDEETKSIIGTVSTKRNIKGSVLMILRKFAVKKVNYIGINETEFFIIRKYFKTNAKRINFKYPNPIQFANQKNEIALSDTQRTSKIILLGNSGDPTNNHIAILKKLKNLACNYKVIVPLSYGSNKEYIQAVQMIGCELLGQHFVPLLDFMLPDEYLKLLSTVDVAIMNHYRQQAAGNLRILLSQGKKVYLNEINPLYQYYIDEGVHLSKLDEYTFEKSFFDDYSDEIKEKNRKAIQALYSQDKIYVYMKELFS